MGNLAFLTIPDMTTGYIITSRSYALGEANLERMLACSDSALQVRRCWGQLFQPLVVVTLFCCA